MKSKIYVFLLFFFLGQNFILAGGIEDDAKDYEDVELTTREDVSEFQELQEPLYEKLEEITSDGCDSEGNVVKWSGGCVIWSGGYIQDGEEVDTFVRYGS
jgi:hypothetical protein